MLELDITNTVILIVAAYIALSTLVRAMLTRHRNMVKKLRDDPQNRP